MRLWWQGEGRDNFVWMVKRKGSSRTEKASEARRKRPAAADEAGASGDVNEQGAGSDAEAEAEVVDSSSDVETCVFRSDVMNDRDGGIWRWQSDGCGHDVTIHRSCGVRAASGPEFWVARVLRWNDTRRRVANSLVHAMTGRDAIGGMPRLPVSEVEHREHVSARINTIDLHKRKALFTST